MEGQSRREQEQESERESGGRELRELVNKRPFKGKTEKG